MATLALSKDLMNDYARLEKQTRIRVTELIAIFQRSSVAELNCLSGVNLKTYHGQLDPRARTIRIDPNLRGVVCAIDNDQTFILHKILHHDDVDAWVGRNRFKANVKTGAVEVYDIEAVEKAAAKAAARPAAGTPLYEHRRDKEFRQLGIDAGLVTSLRAFADEDQLSGILEHLPEGQATALIELRGEESVEEIYRRIAGDFKRGSIDEGDLEKALQTPASRNRFCVVTSDAELQEILEKPLALWRTFLHQSQRAVAYRPVHNGPVRVTGGAGTGKTVVAMHRAKFLADQLIDRGGKPILFTTFARNLVEAIERDLRELGGNDLLDVVEVITVDQLAFRTVRETEGGQVTVCNDQESRRLWEEVADELGGDRSPEFLANEWEQVILAQASRTRDDYFRVLRSGRGIPLDRRGRAEVWRAVELFNYKLADRGRRTFLQLSDVAAGYLARRDVRPYRHVIVDEAQDLHETQWRLLRAAVKDAPNDLFIVGDSHQRIYRRRSSLSRVGINILGRSHKLRINYRTTHEILRWSLRLLGDADYDDLDDGTESHDYAGYHSFAHGPEPHLCRTDSRGAELDALVERIRQWVADGVHEEDIAVAARTQDELVPVERKLQSVGIKCCRLGRSAPAQLGVRTGTMHRMKGTEFRCVAVIGASDDQVPLRPALTDRRADAVQYQLDLIGERWPAICGVLACPGGSVGGLFRRSQSLSCCPPRDGLAAMGRIVNITCHE